MVETLLGIECGGTRTTALLVVEDGKSFKAEFGPANLRLLDDAQLEKRFQEVRGFQSAAGPVLKGLVIGMAGARTDVDKARIRRVAASVWPEVPCYATNDLETALAAVGSLPRDRVRVLILSGTGSCSFGWRPDGRMQRFGGWGHLLGDRGSGYDIGARALKAIAYEADLKGEFPALGREILRSLQLNSSEDLIDWAGNADKTGIAGLAVCVFKMAEKKDRVAQKILSDAAGILANDGVMCARLLSKKCDNTEFVLTGGIFKRQPEFSRKVRACLRASYPKAKVQVLERESVWGAIELAKTRLGVDHVEKTIAVALTEKKIAIPTSTQLSPTEQRNPRSMYLDQLPTAQAIELMTSEDARLPKAILKESAHIEEAIDLIVAAFKKGGHLFYVGAGSSGRIGVLDASEIPPTFRAEPELVQGIIAGGHTALWSAAEGAEDSPALGAAAIEGRGVGADDVVVGIATSGRTPFVWGALDAAKQRGAHTALICFNPYLKFDETLKPDVVIAPCVGPEVLTGSTRLKSGTATKMILNMLTTLSMTRMGKVMSNLMVDVNASNQKLRERAVRIVREITNVDKDAAQKALEEHQWLVKAACKALGKAF